MPVLRVYGYRMVAIPGVKHRHDLVFGDGTDLLRRGNYMVFFPHADFVERLKVDCTPWGSVAFGGGYHAMKPGCRGTGGYFLQYAELDVLVELPLDVSFPVGRSAWRASGDCGRR